MTLTAPRRWLLCKTPSERRILHQALPDALGSPNYYTHGAACNLSKASGFAQVIGAGDFQSDVPNAKMIMYIGRSVADAIRPSHLQDLQVAHENGAKIVVVDPRCNNSTVFADEWLPINPGTDLAFILAMCNVLIRDGIYDKDYVCGKRRRFRRFAAGISRPHPLWAEGVCGISAETIERLAHQFAQAAPAASIDAGWRGGFAPVCQLRRDGTRPGHLQHAAWLLEPGRRRAFDLGCQRG
ncbi:MAG: molybdopterin-dependent oxidoreductase [Slackia sp.]